MTRPPWRDADQHTNICRPKLLVLDTSYTLEAIRERGLEDSVTCRDLEGFFARVWTVHPFATLLTSEGWTPKYGKPVSHQLNDVHTFIEGKVGRYRFFGRLFPFNFLMSQIAIFFSLWRLIKYEKINVIRAGDPLYMGLLAWALARLCAIPFIVRVGSNNDKIFETTGRPMQPRLLFSRRLEKRIERFVLPRANLVAGANQNNLAFALANGARPERSTLFRYGNLIDKRHFVPPENRRIDRAFLNRIGVEPKNFLMYVGRLEAPKHPDDVVRVLAQLRRSGHDIKAVLAGEGRLATMLKDLAKELDVDEHLVLAGNRDQGWLSQIIPQASVVVSPHTGRALTESALAAVPIVAYDIDWQAELIETNVTGVLVPHGDWKGMAAAVESILNDRAFARRIGHAVRARAAKMLDPAALDEHERKHYAALLGTLKAPSYPAPLNEIAE